MNQHDWNNQNEELDVGGGGTCVTHLHLVERVFITKRDKSFAKMYLLEHNQVPSRLKIILA